MFKFRKLTRQGVEDFEHTATLIKGLRTLGILGKPARLSQGKERNILVFEEHLDIFGDRFIMSFQFFCSLNLYTHCSSRVVQPSLDLLPLH
ncbi:Oligopeptide transporter 2 [Fusarium oxysporum f. sp. albedinis]|nr:Oligopeptide transporter 2 [Fusarium oxysporum f. sp. albedinis]